MSLPSDEEKKRRWTYLTEVEDAVWQGRQGSAAHTHLATDIHILETHNCCWKIDTNPVCRCSILKHVLLNIASGQGTSVCNVHCMLCLATKPTGLQRLGSSVFASQGML